MSPHPAGAAEQDTPADSVRILAQRFHCLHVLDAHGLVLLYCCACTRYLDREAWLAGREDACRPR